MLKTITPKSFGQRQQQRPKTVTFFDEEDLYDDDISFMTDDDSVHEPGQTTLGLAKFLATTGPEEFDKKDCSSNPSSSRASRLLNKLRKRPSFKPPAGGGGGIGGERRNHIPLPVYCPTTSSEPRPTLRDSGIYSMSDKESSIAPPPPVPSLPYVASPRLPSSTSLSDLHFPMPPLAAPSPTSSTSLRPLRPNPLPAAVASAAIAAAMHSHRAMSVCSDLSENPQHRPLPPQVIKRRSVRIRHAQVQTDDLDYTDLLKMVESLQLQLEEERALRETNTVP
ncbi:hypothetical protein J3Q64DRAFT_1759383 [Phycomyces blakesleeanus]|uniref:Uncharacterized protein n=2 Tax=Phycomyces blakesleeanus TaxID=4837 RepID=A0A167KET2_PHYB8|nr:hypothetical protein PHYBLDRAFT_173837 [Phycomyces blakesleeanus NRRL 1555(-)]OAD67926.1 hypothetical protein PHYBLDRAFT_173837 [Phycomyces blakesleeanus NRRL 1555(-)]|eukprot:XP_018285966.1 hypothetical protein PHYBLDRAFT_173837 [Phycomyces blakesleeanus NRRL 1555(-)]